MTVVIPEHSGFCPGVKSAEQRVFAVKKARPDRALFVDGFLINNKKYIEYLEGNGVHTVENQAAIPEGATVFIRTHGLDRNEEKRLRSRFDVEDLTCAHVKKVQREIARHAARGFFIVITGTKDHPETKGLVSYAKGRFFVVENDVDLESLAATVLSRALDSPADTVFLCSQTTGTRAFFEKVKSRLESALGAGGPRLSVYDSICPVTERKGEEALRLQREADVSFVIGDRLSSNARKLFQALAATGREVHFIEDVKEMEALGLDLRRYAKALVVSSASTPTFIEKQIVQLLESVEPRV